MYFFDQGASEIYCCCLYNKNVSVLSPIALFPTTGSVRKELGTTYVKMGLHGTKKSHLPMLLPHENENTITLV